MVVQHFFYDPINLDDFLRPFGYNASYVADRNTLARFDKTDCGDIFVPLPTSKTLELEVVLSDTSPLFLVIYPRFWVLASVMETILGSCVSSPNIINWTVKTQLRAYKGDHYIILHEDVRDLTTFMCSQGVQLNCSYSNPNRVEYDLSIVPAISQGSYGQVQLDPAFNFKYIKWRDERFEKLAVYINNTLKFLGAGGYIYRMGVGFVSLTIWAKDVISELLNLTSIMTLIQMIQGMLAVE